MSFGSRDGLKVQVCQQIKFQLVVIFFLKKTWRIDMTELVNIPQGFNSFS